jgi:DNA polymerase (family 10)
MGGKLEGAQSVRAKTVRTVVDDLLYLPTRVEGTKTYMAGSYRRGLEVVGDLDVVVVSEQWDQASWVKALLDVLQLPTQDSERYLTKKGRPRKMVKFLMSLPDAPVCGYSFWPDGQPGVQIDLYFCGPEHYGPMLLYLTGSQAYNMWHRMIAKRNGFKLNQWELTKDGVAVLVKDEADVCSAAGFDWISANYRDQEYRNLWTTT